MKKFIAVIAIFLLVACGPENKIVGKWTYEGSLEKGDIIQTCDFNSNGTEFCEVSLRLNLNFQRVNIDYVATYEWSTEGDVISFKNVDSAIEFIEIDGDDISRADERFADIQGIILANKIKGATSQRRYKFQNSNLLLEAEDGQWHVFKRSA